MPKLIQKLHPACFAAEFPTVELPPLRGKPQYAAGSKDFTLEGERYSLLDTFVQGRPGALLTPDHRCARCGEGFEVGQRGITVSWHPKPGSGPEPRFKVQIEFTRHDGSTYRPDQEEE